MKFGSSLIPLLTATSLSIVTPTLEAKPKKVIENTEAKVVSLLAPEEAEKYLPKPTPVPLADFLERMTPLAVHIPQGDISLLFGSARDYMEKTYQKPKPLEKITTKVGKNTMNWEAIPYIVAEQKFIEGDPRAEVSLIHMLRQKLPDGRLGAWRGPVESTTFSIDVVGVSKYAKNPDDALREKSLGAGTHFQIKDPEGRSYVVLATRYPQQGSAIPNIQTPYSEGLNMPVIVEKGKHYFDFLRQQAQDDVLKASWNSPELQDYGNTMVEILGLVENMNPTHLNLPKQYKQKMLSREITKVYAILGANEERAFRRASNAGANGIMQIIGPTFKYLYSRYLKDILHDGFEVVTGNHRTAIITAKAHIEMQWEEYRKRPLLYNWLMGPGKQYVPYVLAAGYNSNNFHRAKELEDIIRNNILKTPKEIMRLFYERLYMPRGNPNETRLYMQKTGHVIAERGMNFAPLPLE